MTDTKALDALIEAVESGKWSGVNICWKLGDLPEKNGRLAWGAYHGSIDAAKELHDVLLPGWGAKINIGNVDCKYHHCTLEDWDSGEEINADNKPTPSRAWLLAILKAYRATHTQAR